MEPNYGATDDEANTPLMEDSPLLTEKPRRGRAVAVAAVIGTTLMAATVSKTGQQKIADLRASLRTPRGTPSVDWVYDLTVTQDQFWQLTCDLSTPGTQPYALCGLTTCSGLEDYPDVAACKCAPETVNEMYEGTPMESTFRMGSSTVYLSQSETYRNAVAAQYAGTLDLPAFCTALTDGTVCEESGLGCDFISFHTGATNEECRRKALAKGASHSEAKTHVQTKGDSNAGFAWEIDVVEVCMGAPCYKLEGNMGDDSDGCQMACLCPIGAGELEPTFYDDALASDFTDQCFQATTVSTSWPAPDPRPRPPRLEARPSRVEKVGKDPARWHPRVVGARPAASKPREGERDGRHLPVARASSTAMGFFSYLMSFLATKKQRVNILIVGLDNSGKTSIVERMKLRSGARRAAGPAEVAPTVGFNVDEFSSGPLAFTVFDMSGAGRYRSLWEQHYREARAIIFVVDSADTLRLCVAKDELDAMLASDDVAEKPILVFANKADVPSSLSPVDVAQGLSLEDIETNPWQIVPSNALDGTGLQEGVDWLTGFLAK